MAQAPIPRRFPLECKANYGQIISPNGSVCGRKTALDAMRLAAIVHKGYD
jgi:hypothetical protein